jgi:hypothetical protein
MMWSDVRAGLGAARTLVPAFTVALLSGCAVTATGLDRVVLAYDTSTGDAVSKQLLVNIARASRNEPMHFTSVSSIAATFKISVNGGFGPAQAGPRGGTIAPVFGASAEENPTISIAPMQGDEFTQRLLTPFPEQKLTLLLRQGYDVDSLLRLIGAEVQIDVDAAHRIVAYSNRPSDRDGYTVYRRVMTQLSSIQDRHALHVEPLYFQRTWVVPADTVTPETYGTIYKDYTLALDEATKTYRVSKRVIGRVMISNYDPAVLSNDERLRLHAEAEEAPINEILIDIRAGFVGGEYPMHGRLQLRSFHEILNFVGRGVGEEPEFDVPPDPRTPPVDDNPVRALGIAESVSRPDADLVVAWRDRYYAIAPDQGYAWNRKAFSLLFQLFQMSMSANANAGPAITISK